MVCRVILLRGRKRITARAGEQKSVDKFHCGFVEKRNHRKKYCDFQLIILIAVGCFRFAVAVSILSSSQEFHHFSFSAPRIPGTHYSICRFCLFLMNSISFLCSGDAANKYSFRSNSVFILLSAHKRINMRILQPFIPNTHNVFAVKMKWHAPHKNETKIWQVAFFLFSSHSVFLCNLEWN